VSPARTGSSPPDQVARFLLELGRQLLVAGDAVTDIEARLRRIAATWGHPHAQFSVLPATVLVTLDPQDSAQLATTVGLPALRLDQVTEVFTVGRDAEAGRLDAEAGLARLRALPEMEHRYTVAGSIAGQVAMVLGIALAGTPSGAPLWLYAALALVVALLRRLALREPELEPILPVIAAAAVSIVAFSIADRVYDETSLQTLIPPLVMLLPGALLTMAVIDLASGETVTGASRFLAGLLQLALLTAGLVAGAAIVGVTPPTAPLLAEAAAWWVPWLGVIVFGCGMALQRSVPARMLPWLLVVLFGAFAGQIAGEELFGPELSGFAGGIVVAPLALLVERVPSGPPAFVTFLPAFWLLVPGALSLAGVSEIVIADPIFGFVSFLEAISAVVAIALGILVGTRLSRVAGVAAR
jgi:uncharacterized membrane protein YjjP (DUF1212 family)